MQTYLGTNVVTTTSSPSIMTSDTIITSTTIPIDTTTTSKPATTIGISSSDGGIVLFFGTSTATSSYSIRTTNTTMDANNVGT